MSAAVAPVATAPHIAARLAYDFMLRSIHLMAEMTDGDIVGALIMVAILRANVAHLDTPDGPYAGPPPADSERRPASVLSLSQSLQMPYETTRRHVAKLAAAGLCQRVKGGVIVTAATISTPDQIDRAKRNFANLKRLVRGIQKTGMPLD